MTKPRPLIAVVDDEEPVRVALWRLLRSAGLDVETSPSGAEFLEKISSHPTNAKARAKEVAAAVGGRAAERKKDALPAGGGSMAGGSPGGGRRSRGRGKAHPGGGGAVAGKGICQSAGSGARRRSLPLALPDPPRHG